MNIDILILSIFVLILHISQYYLRYIYFYRKPSEDCKIPNKNTIISPVEGRVVYIKYSSEEMTKEGRKLSLPFILKPDLEYLHIGIFLSPYNNHHLLNPSTGNYNRLPDEHGELNSMMDYKDLLNPSWFISWFDKKYSKFINLNTRSIFVNKNGIVMVMIYDKYVNKMTMIRKCTESKREIISFVHRGSQVDLFIPKSLGFILNTKVGDKVNHNTVIFRK